jgi:NADH dehydrogenase
MIDRSEELVTVFGGDGFIGRYVCEFLLRSGVRVRVASRDRRNSYFMQPLGQVGQFGFVQADITDAAAVARAIEGANRVINLVGVFKKMQSVQVDGARNVAEAAKRVGA